MAWGKTTGVEDLIVKLQRNECRTLCILKHRTFAAGQISAFTDALAKNCSLTELLMSGIDIGDEGLQLVGQALGQHNRTLERLCIGQSTMGDAGVRALLVDMGSNVGLLYLDLEFKSMTSAATSVVVNLLSRHATLQCLKLGRNQLGDAGVQQLCEGLQQPSSARCLTSLDIGENGITSEGATELAKVLQDSKCLPQLTDLILSENALGDVGGETILTALAARNNEKTELKLKSHCKLHRLVMRNCGLGKRSGSQFGLYLSSWKSNAYNSKGAGEHVDGSSNSRIGGAHGGDGGDSNDLSGDDSLTLDFTGNRMGEAGAEMLAGALAQCVRGMSMFLANNCITDEAACAIGAVLKQKRHAHRNGNGSGGDDNGEGDGNGGGHASSESEVDSSRSDVDEKPPSMLLVGRLFDFSSNNLSHAGCVGLLAVPVTELRLFDNHCVRRMIAHTVKSDAAVLVDGSSGDDDGGDGINVYSNCERDEESKFPGGSDGGRGDGCGSGGGDASGGDDGKDDVSLMMISVLEVINGNNMLRTLDLGANRMSGETICQLCAGLETHASLQTLELGGNDIDERAKAGISKLQQANKKLDIAFQIAGGG